MYGSQRLALGAARWGEIDLGQAHLLPAYLWDARYAGELRAAVGGSASRVPGFGADGLPAESLGSGGDTPSRAERSRLSETFAGSFAEAGFEVADDDPEAPWPRFDRSAFIRTADPVRLLHDLRLFARRFGFDTWTLWADYHRYLQFSVDGDNVRVAWRSIIGSRSVEARELPRVSPDVARYQVDLDLVRAGRLTPADVHPLVRAALFRTGISGPSPMPAAGGVVGSSAGPVAGPSPMPAVGGVVGSSAGPVARPSAVPAPGAAPVSTDDGPVRVRCRGDWHEVDVRLGHLDLLAHPEAERRRERALSAFGGAVSGCFAAAKAWHGAPGRLPRRLRAHREDLWQRMIHGGTRTVLELLDAGMDPQLRDGRGGTLLHRLRAFDHGRLLPRLLAEGLDVNARDKEGSTPLYLSVVHRWPADLIIALVDSGADPYLPDRDGMSVIDHCEDYLDYRDDLDPDFEAAIAYLRKRTR
ncbi:hypothetical protein, partial [Actinoplanes philippinensis]|uniref:hypothetical protein n=1 Tax=Actinoplanes philippinensis TaxID=35752 RepID=UPI0033E1668A